MSTGADSLSIARIPRPAGIPEPQAGELALYGGGDYELIFTLPKDRHPVSGVRSTVIGEVIADKAVLVDGVAPARRGYQHHWT